MKFEKLDIHDFVWKENSKNGEAKTSGLIPIYG